MKPQGCLATLQTDEWFCASCSLRWSNHGEGNDYWPPASVRQCGRTLEEVMTEAPTIEIPLIEVGEDLEHVISTSLPVSASEPEYIPPPSPEAGEAEIPSPPDAEVLDFCGELGICFYELIAYRAPLIGEYYAHTSRLSFTRFFTYEATIHTKGARWVIKPTHRALTYYLKGDPV